MALLDDLRKQAHLRKPHIKSTLAGRGEVAEWLNAAVLKCTPLISIRAAKCREVRAGGASAA